LLLDVQLLDSTYSTDRFDAGQSLTIAHTYDATGLALVVVVVVVAFVAFVAFGAVVVVLVAFDALVVVVLGAEVVVVTTMLLL
tara:strand:+ start:518 stop:766 length:249 start_codon:yes stop_codon:yes gene_type:complete